ncbi:hypothetical protein SAMN05216205_3957 [Pseudomonas mohnii]|uniref:EF-hand domain-containing protein n=1 Tax=Pseudomonas mohnii TaxID=395600 RepID=A0ABY0Y6N4_9PSED|nr:hypothetical protein [Pseudomonas mohnii]SED02344.1 hypothetical protein SAMN05216205_3957 [Pseudomonas mohnii]
MPSTERPARFWLLLCGVIIALNLSVPAQAITPPDSPALDRRTCLANGNWYGFYRNNHGLIPICLKLPEAISAKMLDSNDDGVVDGNDLLSNGVTFIGENSPRDADDNGAEAHESIGDDTPGLEKSGGSRRIMWRQIQ